MTVLDIFIFLKECVKTPEGKVLYLLAIISIAMVIDFITGTIAAIVNPKIEVKSKTGINGILRKIASMLLLIVFLPLSVLIPNGAGMALVCTLYGGYLVFEVKSIIENIEKNGTDTTLFKNILEKISNNKMTND
nr:MAG TPA: holin [Caudoviricetes sp.]